MVKKPSVAYSRKLITEAAEDARRLIEKARAEAEILISKAAGLSQISNEKIDLAVMATQVADIRIDVKDIKDTIKNDYVTSQAFEPVRKIVYGLVAILGAATIGALLKLIFVK